MDPLNILIGFLIGLLMARLLNKISGNNVITTSLIVAQVQSLRILSKSIKHFYTIRHWHEKAAWSLDDAHGKLKKELKNDKKITVELPDGQKGFVELTDKEIEDISENWLDSRVQELKAVWNDVLYDDEAWKINSTTLLRSAMVPYDHLIAWKDWKEAMDYLARYELLLLKYTKKAKEQKKKKS